MLFGTNYKINVSFSAIRPRYGHFVNNQQQLKNWTTQVFRGGPTLKLIFGFGLCKSEGLHIWTGVNILQKARAEVPAWLM